MIDDDRRIAVERQSLRSLLPHIGREIETRIAGRQDGGDGQPRHREHLSLRRLSDGLMLRQKHEICTLRQRNEILRAERDILSAEAPHTAQSCRIEDIALFVCIDGRNELISLRHRDTSSAWEGSAAVPTCSLLLRFFSFLGL